MLLLSGPAGSGKTSRILERLRDALRRRDSGVRMLTPTATMAQHLQNQLAREGFVFRPAIVQTLSRFVEPFAADLPAVSEPLLYLIVEEAAARLNPPEFARVVRLPGFCAALARTIEEFSSAGCDAERLANSLPRAGGLAPLGEAFLAIYRAAERELARRGLATRSQHLRHAADRMSGEGHSTIHTIWLDGFYALPDPELAVIRALCRHADVTLTLPAATITEPTRERLLAMGFMEELCAWQPAPPRIELCPAPSIEREADEIARRILQQAASGRLFRDMGVIVRSPEVYEPILRATLDRFGIPARFYFDTDLSRHAVVRYFSGIVDAMLGGWDHAETLAAIRLAPGIACDEFDFAVRERIPGKGLAALRALAAGAQPAILGLFESLEQLEAWRAISITPPEWAERLQGLREFFSPGCPEPGSHEAAAIARSQAEALDLFDAAMFDAAAGLGAPPVKLGEFWRAAKSVLRLMPLRVADSRRNVVHVLGAHEARQWRLPVIFVCGLVEKQFPKFHAQDPFFPDSVRAHLKQAGIRLRTAAEFEAEERFLFDSASSRATESLTLTYPHNDARGQQNLASLYLDGFPAMPAEWKAVLPQAPAQRSEARPPAAISSPDLRASLLTQHHKFGPRALETFLQCPFQFFGRETLRLKEPPPRPEERLDFRAQGTVVHEVLSALHADPQPLDELFDAVFARVCAQQRIPSCYRTEALRQRMLSDLRALVTDPAWKPRGEILAEHRFRYTLGADVEISGRIDRIDLQADDGPTVIDYKYSPGQAIKALGKSANVLQPQLYMLALERTLHLHPAGMSYWGFKKQVERTPLIQFAPAPAIETVLRIADEVRAGRIEPHPADIDKCRLCELLDVCRYRAARAAAAEGEAEWN